MNGYYFDLRCPDCGQSMTHRADGRPGLASTQAVADCGYCGRAYVVRVELLTAGSAPRIEDRRVSRHDPIGPVHPVIGMIMEAEDERRKKVPA